MFTTRKTVVQGKGRNTEMLPKHRIWDPESDTREKDDQQ